MFDVKCIWQITWILMSSSFAALKSKKAVLHQVGSLCTLVNQILVFRKDLKFKSLAIKRLEISKTYWFCFVWRKKIVYNSHIFKVSSDRTHIHVLHASYLSASNFGVPKRIKIQIFCSYKIRNTKGVLILFRLAQKNCW